MDIPTKIKSGEATGISRSGRVRKKSSKLTDFESPDEIDTRFKRRTDRPQKVVAPKPLSEDSDSYLDEEIIDVKDEPLEVEEWGVEGEEMEEGEEEEEEEESVGGEDGGGGEGNLPEFSDPLHVDEDSTDVSRETTNYTQAQSLYFSEKQGKKSVVMKGGQVVRRKKAQRKDKGKSRFTAYMLWAREVRPGIIQANPNMDFSAVNKRLGELWALVPTTQKYNWKRRAKRLAAKGNQKGGLISTGRPSRPPPPARANLINKGGVKPAPRSDPNPTPPPPAPATQGAGHHRQPGQKVTKYRGKRRQPPESGATTAAKRLGECLSPCPAQSTFPVRAATLGRKCGKVNQKSRSTARKKGLSEYNAQCSSPPGTPIQGKKYPNRKEELDLCIQKGILHKTVMKGDKAKEMDSEVERKKVTEVEKKLEQEVQCETDPLAETSETESATSSVDNLSVELTMTSVMGGLSSSYHEPSNATEQISHPPVAAEVKVVTMDDIFRDLFRYPYKCPYCPLSLAQAVAGVAWQQLTLKKASALFCVSPTRLQMCLSYISMLQKESTNRYYQLLEEMRRYPTHEAVTEWLLRMRRMGRPPVMADIKQVTHYLGKEVHRAKWPTGYFLKVFGEQSMSHEEWVVLSHLAASRWYTRFQKHVFIRCGMNPYELLTPTNSPQVFTSAEVLVGIGELPREVTILRGRSNLYCLTQQDIGASRAILTFSGAGQFHPPTIMQKGYSLPHWALTEKGVDLIASPDGKLDPLLFLGWLRLFEKKLTEARLPRPVVLFVHGHPAHGSPAADAFCSAKGIILHSHHHSPINPMDPFIYLLPPLLHHLGRTQNQLTALTGIHPLPDYLLPSILADAWIQVSQEKLAGEAFLKSGLVPYENFKCFASDRFVQTAAYPPLLLQPFKVYHATGNHPAEDPYDPEPQIFTSYHLRTVTLNEKSQCNIKQDKGKITQEKLYQKSPCSLEADEEKITQKNLTCTSWEDREEVFYDDSEQTCDPLYVKSEPVSDLYLMESGRVIHIKNDCMASDKSLSHNSDNSSEGELDELPLTCEIQEPVSWSESWQNPHVTHEKPTFTRLEKLEEVDSNSNQACDPLFVGPDSLPELYRESERVVHVHNNLVADVGSSANNSSEESPVEELGPLPLPSELQESISWSDSRLFA